MYTITLTDASSTATLPLLNVPLSESILEGATDVVTLDNNISTYFTDNKRMWNHNWAYLSEEDYLVIKGFYDRQWTLFAYPQITIEGLDVTNIPVRMTISPRNIVDHCGTVEGVEVTFRESRQMP